MIALAVALVWNLRSQPQLGPDEEVYNTVDALYTAVRNRDTQQIGKCESKLNHYRETGKLPAGAAEKLAGIVSKALGGSWDTAAERLYEFMAAQKRETFSSHSASKEEVRKKKN